MKEGRKAFKFQNYSEFDSRFCGVFYFKKIEGLDTPDCACDLLLSEKISQRAQWTIWDNSDWTQFSHIQALYPLHYSSIPYTGF